MRVVVENLTKMFGNTTAVDDISFSFGDGEIFGFVGPNGAGKTTTMRILATLEEPTMGEALLDGHSVVQEPERARKRIGFVPDALPDHADITVHEYLDFFARAYGIKGNERREVVQSVEDFTNLTGIRDKMLKACSKGMKQRVCLARALVHDPPVLILDEPASGLDPRARVELRELLRALAGQGKAILISSHILTELAEICTGAVIIEQGKILRAGRLDTIMENEQALTVRKLIIRPLGDPEDLHRALVQRPLVGRAALAGKEVAIEFAGTEDEACELLKSLIADGYRIAEFKQPKTNLEEIFMNITKGGVQ